MVRHTRWRARHAGHLAMGIFGLKCVENREASMGELSGSSKDEQNDFVMVRSFVYAAAF